MATRSKTTRWGFPTRLTDVATNTTLGTATRYDFAAKTITMETGGAGRTVKNAWIRVTFDVANTAAKDVDAWRLGIKINAVAFDDVDTTSSPANSGESEHVTVFRNVTAYFVANDPGTATFTVRVGVAVAVSASADVIRNITCELFITYEYDDAATSHIKTVLIPIQCNEGRLTTSYVAVGETGTSPAPANQIPNLSTFLPESTVTILDNYLIITACRGTITTVDYNMDVRLDGATTLARATCEAALASGPSYMDIIDSSLMPSTSAAHAIEAKASAVNIFENVGAVQVVTYSFDPAATTTVLNSIIVPLVNQRSELPMMASATGANNDRLLMRVDIEEPGTITMKQSAVLLHSHMFGNGIARSLGATGQTVRGYIAANAVVRDSGNELIHRVDHSSSDWALARGWNNLRFQVEDATNDERPYSGYAILNYTSSKAALGVGVHNHTTWWSIKDLEGTSVVTATVTPSAPAIPESVYRLNGVSVEAATRSTSTQLTVSASRETGEDGAAGWYTEGFPRWGGSSEIGTKLHTIAATRWFKRDTLSGATDAANIKTARDWRFSGDAPNLDSQFAAQIALTYHAITFTVAGTIEEDGVGVGDGETVQIFGPDEEGHPILIASTDTAGGSGGFTVEVLGDAASHFASYTTAPAGRSLVGTPDVDAFDIAMNSGGGGPPDSTAPDEDVVSPDAGEAPGAPGAFSDDYSVAAVTPIIVDVDDAGGVSFVKISISFSPASFAGRREVFDGADFVEGFTADSTVTPIANGFRFSIRHDGGWPSGVNVSLHIKAVDFAGNVLE